MQNSLYVGKESQSSWRRSTFPFSIVPWAATKSSTLFLSADERRQTQKTRTINPTKNQQMFLYPKKELLSSSLLKAGISDNRFLINSSLISIVCTIKQSPNGLTHWPNDSFYLSIDVLKVVFVSFLLLSFLPQMTFRKRLGYRRFSPSASLRSIFRQTGNKHTSTEGLIDLLALFPPGRGIKRTFGALKDKKGDRLKTIEFAG